LGGKLSKRLGMALTIIPLIYTFGHKSPLYFISPAIIWQEWNYPPWSDVINRWWPIVFTDKTFSFLAYAFSFIIILALVSMNRKSKGN